MGIVVTDMVARCGRAAGSGTLIEFDMLVETSMVAEVDIPAEAGMSDQEGIRVEEDTAAAAGRRTLQPDSGCRLDNRCVQALDILDRCQEGTCRSEADAGTGRRLQYLVHGCCGKRGLVVRR